MTDHLSVIHKNEDASKKWCPFSGSLQDSRNSKIRKMLPGTNCLTTGCMAWVDETDHIYEIAMGRCGLISLPPF